MKRKFLCELDKLTDEIVPNKLDEVMNATKTAQIQPDADNTIRKPIVSRMVKLLVPIICCITLLIGIGVFSNGEWNTPPIAPDSTVPDNAVQSSRPVTESGDTLTNQQSNPPETGSITGPNTTTPQGGTNPSNPQTDEPTLSPLEDPSIIWADNDGSLGDLDMTTWKGKTMRESLWNAINHAEYTEATRFAIGIRFSTFDSEYQYRGKTLAEYEADDYEERNLTDKLEQLLKEGDYLKYGENLYKTGTPDGVKWLKQHYEDRIAFYGEELLSKYIVNSEFLCEKVEADLASPLPDKAQKAYSEARAAYLNETVQTMQKYLIEQNIQNEILAKLNMETDFYGYVNLILYPTKEQFTDLSFESLGYFGLTEFDIVFALVTKDMYNGLPFSEPPDDL